MTPEALELRRRIFTAFAATGGPPPLAGEDPALVDELVAAHVIVLGDDGAVRMAHPFAGHHEGARLEAVGGPWWGNCAWDALGIAAAVGRREGRIVDASGIEVRLRGGAPQGDAVFHVAVPAAEWWSDIGHT
jgi:Alkylmercury lyase